MKRGLILFLLVLLPSAYALNVQDQQCFPNGQFIITLEAVDSNITYTDQIKIVIDGKEINGGWNINFMKKNPPDRTRQYATFTSNEGVVFGGKEIMEITYPLESDQIKITESIQEVLECPPFIFSCALLNMEIEECYTAGSTFKAFFNARGFEQSQAGKLDVDENLVFNLFTKNVYEDIENRITTRGSKPKGATIERYEGDRYLFTYKFPEENSVDRFRVGFANLDKCLNPEYDKYGLITSDVKGCEIKSDDRKVETSTVKKPEKISEPEAEIIPEKEMEERAMEDDSLTPVIILAIIIAAFILIIKFKKKILKPKK